MSITPYFYVEKYSHQTKKYELQHPFVWDYNHTKHVIADLYPYQGDHDLFSIIGNDVGEYDFPYMFGIHGGLPKDVSKEIREEYDSFCFNYENNGNVRSYTPKVYYFTYADMYIYCLEHPEYEDDNGKKNPIPLNRLMNKVNVFLEIMDEDWKEYYSQIRIIYWFE